MPSPDLKMSKRAISDSGNEFYKQSNEPKLFKGLQNFILSEIDSGSEEEEVKRQPAREEQSIGAEESSMVQHQVLSSFSISSDGATGGNSPNQGIGSHLKQQAQPQNKKDVSDNDDDFEKSSPSPKADSPVQESMLTSDALQNFITQSPFSFKNSIFFSVPTRDMNQRHNVHHLLKDTKRKLFPTIVEQNAQEQIETVDSTDNYGQSMQEIPLGNISRHSLLNTSSQLSSMGQKQQLSARDPPAKMSEASPTGLGGGGIFGSLPSSGGPPRNFAQLVASQQNSRLEASSAIEMVNNPTKQIFAKPTGKFFAGFAGANPEKIPAQSLQKDQNVLSNFDALKKQLQQTSLDKKEIQNAQKTFAQMSFTPAPKSNTFKLLTNMAGEPLSPFAAYDVEKVVEPVELSKHTISQVSSPVKQNAADWMTPNKFQLDDYELTSTRHKNRRESDLKRDLVETPNSKHRYKQMARDLKDAEKAGGLEDMIKLVFTQIVKLPRKIHWRVILDLADFAKRESKFTEAKYLFKLVAYLQPFAYQGWLEFAKMEEECGNTNLSWRILQVGLRFNQLNENLFVKAVKVLEKLKKYQDVRKLLAELADVPLEKTWRILMEGALFEGRIGNKTGARDSFSYLTEVCPTYGPIYLEASKYEEKENEIAAAVKITSDGIDHNPKYGPLWFQYLRLYEKSTRDQRSQMFEPLDSIIDDMFQNVSRELEWKVSIEAAQSYDRLYCQPFTSQVTALTSQGLKHRQQTLKYLQQAIKSSPDNLKWKIWLIASRIQLRMGDSQQARETIERCCQEVPQKQMSMALLEYAKYFEMVDQVDRARLVMSQAKHLVKAEWKLYFEAVMLEFRQGNFEEAEKLVTESLEVHFATGRLWATLIQMQHSRATTRADFELVNDTFIKALNEIPKSGEVWCEGARLAMSRHSLNPYFDLAKAKDYLEFALQFTPQYGDSFLEMMRLVIMQANESEEAATLEELNKLRQLCVHAEPNYGLLWFFNKNSITDNAYDIWERTLVEMWKNRTNNKTGKVSNREDEFWLGSPRLIRLLRGGLKIRYAEQTASSSTEQSKNVAYCDFDTKCKVVYGFEQILPQVAYL